MEVTDDAERYLRTGDPDASFVYLGLVDETAHLAGSALPAYATAIATTDGRIGRLIRAVRSRPSYPFENWTILVTTDHGQQALTEPSLVSHLSQTPLEITSFVIGSGPGLGRKIVKPRVVDIAPTVLHQLGVRVRPSWKLDGRSLSRSRASSWAFAAVRGGPEERRLVTSLRFGSPPKGVTSAVVHLPAAVSVDGGVKAIRALVNGGPASLRLVRTHGGGHVQAPDAQEAGRGDRAGRIAGRLRPAPQAQPGRDRGPAERQADPRTAARRPRRLTRAAESNRPAGAAVYPRSGFVDREVPSRCASRSP